MSGEISPTGKRSDPGVLVNKAITAAFEEWEYGLTREQFEQLVVNCFYMPLFEVALTTQKPTSVVSDIHSRVAQLSS
jgi:hypothetical protein